MDFREVDEVDRAKEKEAKGAPKEGEVTRKVDGCQLEVDQDRGVVYVHGPQGCTLVRICRIPMEIAKGKFIDVVFDRELAKVWEGWR